jgi:hypothetical protein
MFVFFTLAPMCAALQAISKKLLHLRPLCATANKEVGHIVLAEVARLKKLSPRTFSRVAYALCLQCGISNLFTTLHALAANTEMSQATNRQQDAR